MDDPELLSTRKFVALYEAKIADALKRLCELDPGSYRDALAAKWAEFKAANSQPAATDEERQAKAAAIGETLKEIDQLIEVGGSQADAWLEVDNLIKARLAATRQEQTRLLEMQQMLSVEEALHLIVTLHGILRQRLRRHPKLLTLIGGDIEKQFGLGGEVVDVDAKTISDSGNDSSN